MLLGLEIARPLSDNRASLAVSTSALYLIWYNKKAIQ